MVERKINYGILDELEDYKSRLKFYRICFWVLWITLLLLLLLFSLININSDDDDDEILGLLMFQLEYMDYIYDKYDLNMSEEYDGFLRFKMEELINK